MPFEQLIPRPFTSSGVRMYAPATSGVYGISNSREWLYIGDTDNIQSALLAHMQEPQTALMNSVPTGFVFEICDGALRPVRYNRLIGEYAPTCNRSAGRKS